MDNVDFIEDSIVEIEEDVCITVIGWAPQNGDFCANCLLERAIMNHTRIAVTKKDWKEEEVEL